MLHLLNFCFANIPILRSLVAATGWASEFQNGQQAQVCRRHAILNMYGIVIFYTNTYFGKELRVRNSPPQPIFNLQEAGK